MVDKAEDLLAAVYSRLGLEEGALRAATESATADVGSAEEWVEYGDWLSLAHRVGAQRVFFVKQDPVLVFTQLNALDEAKLLDAHRRAWCLARPQCLFVAVPGELRVYSLTTPPVRTLDEWKRIEPLAVVNRAADVADALLNFQRASVESGAVFEHGDFGALHQRADQALIADLRKLRRVLLDTGLSTRHAHALIGRAIFIRYLEDRGILRRSYFASVAKDNPKWLTLLEDEEMNVVFASTGAERFFDRILRDKQFTYALFEQLAQDFNGDMFPRDADEQRQIRVDHLRLLRHFLLGDTSVEQYSLFFWAYDFSIIPLELISSIYEEFYHDSYDDDKGTHYTPQRLVSDVLARVLPVEVLARSPRVLDPACGSGAFLGEAYKRIVRYRSFTLGRSLSNQELREILRRQIAGIELNPESVRVAAFSLYLALLNFQDPPTVRANRRLPHLVYEGQDDSAQNYNIFVCANAFAPTLDEYEELSARAEVPRFEGRKILQQYLASSGSLPFRRADFDVVVGNPPWEEARTEVRPRKVRVVVRAPVKDAEVGRIALGWAAAFRKPVGDNSNSQLFIHRALALVKPNGQVGLLVHASVLSNQRSSSLEFRHVLLSKYCIEEVVNYSQVRRLYFDHGIAPFVFVRIRNTEPDLKTQSVVYTAARLTRLAERLHSGVLSAVDRRVVPQRDFLERDYLWKTYTWGGQRDAALMAALDAEPSLADYLGKSPLAGYGFQRGGLPVPASLRKLPALGSRRLTWYGPLVDGFFEDRPTGVSYTPDERLYRGQRLLATRGVKGQFGVCTRLEDEPFSFRHLVYCVHLGHLPEWQAKVIVGLTWSSLGRYWLFMQSASWGLWYDQFVAEDWLNFPVRLPKEQTRSVRRICDVVDQVRSADAVEETLTGDKMPVQPPSALLRELDSAAFDLFDLADDERELVEDWNTYSYDMLVNGADSFAVSRLSSLGPQLDGTVEELKAQNDSELHRYLRAFVVEWAAVLDNPTDLRWSVVAAPGASHIAVVIGTERMDSLADAGSSVEWANILARATSFGSAEPLSALYVDGILRAVTENFVLVAKRNERRLWTASAAREDAEATLLRALRIQSGEPEASSAAR